MTPATKSLSVTRNVLTLMDSISFILKPDLHIVIIIANTPL